MPHRLAGTGAVVDDQPEVVGVSRDRKSTRLNSSQLGISYAVFCLKKKHFTADQGDLTAPTVWDVQLVVVQGETEHDRIPTPDLFQAAAANNNEQTAKLLSTNDHGN